MSKIGRYEIERELGRGAMGVVYLARDPQLQRRVAVKTCALPDGISEELARQFHERFLREARSAAALSHPGIVTVYDAGDDAPSGRPYIAMEYVPGQTLRQRLEKRERLDPEWVFAFGAVLADALHQAHRAGIVHRDIKPANILIREGDGAVKLADFGVARLKASDLTQSGVPLGSPGYMSPEQVKGGDLDGRSDLFSLAVVLYEALSGKRPFRGDELVSLAYSIAHETHVPLGRVLEGCPAGLDAFFERALAKDPARRFPDGAAFRRALVEVGKGYTPDRSDMTVADASTVAMAPGAMPAAATTLAPPVASADAPPRRKPPVARSIAARAVSSAPPAVASAAPAAGTGRSRAGLALALLLLGGIGLATAAWLAVGRPALLHAGQRPVTATSVVPSTEGATPPPVAGAAPRGQVASAAPIAQAAPTASAVPAAQAAPAGHDIAPPERPRTRLAADAGEPVPPAPPLPRLITLTVPAGTEIHLTLDGAVGSATSHPGDVVVARMAEPVLVGERVVAAAGSAVRGRVTAAVPAGRGLRDKAGSLSLAFESVVVTDGSAASISAGATMNAQGSGGRTAAAIGGGAAGGALLGRLARHERRAAALGSLMGAAIGTGVAAGMRGEDITLDAGAPLTIRLDQPLTIRVYP
jgi:protein kinase-like protein